MFNSQGLRDSYQFDLSQLGMAVKSIHLGGSGFYTEEDEGQELVASNEGILADMSKSGTAYSKLPTELIINIFFQADPVTRVCLAVTSADHYRAYRSSFYSGGKSSQRPVPLRMQVSLDGIYAINGNGELWECEHEYENDWDPCLADLLWNEVSLFQAAEGCDELDWCDWCYVVKPLRCFEAASSWDNELLEDLETRHSEVYHSGCRRCRVRFLLTDVEGRRVVWSNFPQPDSLGLYLNEGRTWDQMPPATFNSSYRMVEFDRARDVHWTNKYASWEEVFATLGI